MATQITVHPLSERSSFYEAQGLRERNEFSFRSTCSYKQLPEAHVAVQATEASVLATATDIDVLGEWLYVQGGTITTVDLPSGQTVWTLHTETWTDSPVKFPVVPVHLSVVLPTGEQVMHEIASAVVAA
ncbi:hypothetical protein ACIQ9J_01845 [Streptomyces sp. NPDC094153]|uniref:hypothetical protein n=1 Tax=Streptomyces sp. NPDC094153 TaxID=3366058 RepID=UPI003824CEBE